MQLYYHYFPVLLLIAGLIMTSLGVFSLFRRNLPGAGIFSLLMFAGAEIAVFYFFEISCVELSFKLLFLKFQYIGMSTISVLWLLMAAHFSGFRSVLSAKYVILLFIVPLITIVLVWTNQYHAMVWRDALVKITGGLRYLDAVNGYWTWVYLFYTYGTFIIGSVFLIRYAVRAKGLHRSQSIAFLIASVLPFGMNVLYSFNFIGRIKLDLAPVSFAFTGIALWWAVFRYNLLGIMPAAKEIVLENMRAGIIVTDLKNHVIEVNSFIGRLFAVDLSKIIGKKIESVWVALPDIEEGNPILYEREGEELYIEVDKTAIKNSKGDITGRLYMIFNVTERRKAEFALKRAEEIIFESQKIEALGRLSDGIAHEFNNILTIVYNYSKYAVAGPEKDFQDYPEDFKQIHAAVQRGRELTKQLLMFSKKHIAERNYISLDSVITTMREILYSLVKKNVKLVFDSEIAAGIIFANQHQIEQIILNLVKNGDDAMPDGGTLRIIQGQSYIEEHHFPGHTDLRPGTYSFIRVEDTGKGIPEEIRERIFDPFFTTKEIGSGSGLGLSTVYGVVKQYKGHIDFVSTPGKGTVFTVYIPTVTQT